MTGRESTPVLLEERSDACPERIPRRGEKSPDGLSHGNPVEW